jgi:hypothetical protein
LRCLHVYSSEADRPVYKAEFSRELGALREDLRRLLSESSEVRNQAESLAREDLRRLLSESSEIRRGSVAACSADAGEAGRAD